MGGGQGAAGPCEGGAGGRVLEDSPVYPSQPQSHHGHCTDMCVLMLQGSRWVLPSTLSEQLHQGPPVPSQGGHPGLGLPSAFTGLCGAHRKTFQDPGPGSAAGPHSTLSLLRGPHHHLRSQEGPRVCSCWARPKGPFCVPGPGRGSLGAFHLPSCLLLLLHGALEITWVLAHTSLGTLAPSPLPTRSMWFLSPGPACCPTLRPSQRRPHRPGVPVPHSRPQPVERQHALRRHGAALLFWSAVKLSKQRS